MTVYLGPPEASPVVEVESSPSPTRTVPNVPRIVPPVPVAPVVVPPVAAMTPLMQARRGTTCYQLPTQDIQIPVGWPPMKAQAAGANIAASSGWHSCSAMLDRIQPSKAGVSGSWLPILRVAQWVRSRWSDL